MALFAKRTTTTLTVEGMTCENCVRHVTQALQDLPGVQRVQVDLEAKRAEVRHGTQTDPTMLADAIAQAGYKAEPVA